VYFAAVARSERANPLRKDLSVRRTACAWWRRAIVPLPNVTPPFNGAATSTFDLGVADISSDGQLTAFGAGAVRGSDVVLCSKQSFSRDDYREMGNRALSRDAAAQRQRPVGVRRGESSERVFRTLGYCVNLATGRSLSPNGHTSRSHSSQHGSDGVGYRDGGLLRLEEYPRSARGRDIAIPTLGIVFDAVIDAADKIVFLRAGRAAMSRVRPRHRSRITSPGAAVCCWRAVRSEHDR
jgi:hypothetical protein